MKEIRIAHLFPEALNTGGDGGNILCLQKRLQWRGIGCEVDRLRLDEKKSLAGYDLLYIGGGQEFEREAVLAGLRTGRDGEIRAALADGTVVLATGGGFQLMGQYFETRQGDRFHFLGAADFHTVEGAERLVGNYAFRLGEESGGGIVVGFENHSGRTHLAQGTEPLGSVLTGHGNNGEDGTEGVRLNNLFGSYAHGPLLPKNAFFCDFLLRTALERKCGSGDLAPLDDTFETLAHDTVLAKMRKSA